MCLHPFHPHHQYATQILPWALQCIILSTESTADLANISNSPTRNWSKPNWRFATGMSMTICIFGLRFPYILTESYRVDYRSLEAALIQEWQPRLNFPFICQFYHPKKGLLKKTLLHTNAQFGLATLWRRAKHKFTPQLVRQVLMSSRFQNRLDLWTIVHALGSNTKARFEQTKMLRSNDGGLLLCYALRRLANNTQEPFRTLSLTAIDASIKWWHGKPAPRASALRAPWSLSPNLQSQLKKFLRQWHLQMLDHQVPCHTPSFKTVFIKHAAVLDILCNHKQAIEDWPTSNPAICCCKSWSDYKKAALNPSDPHWVLSGSLLHSLLLPELAVIAEGSLSNKVFPSKKEYFNQMRQAIKTWTKKNGLPSMPQADISDLCHHLWSEHTQQITNHITKSSINQLQSTFDGAIFHCEDATTCEITPSLSRVEERALLTYNVLLNTHRLESFTVYNLLYCISQHIWYTWDHYLPPPSMDIKWQDETGDTFALRNENRLVDLLHEFRPQWLEGQECGLLFPNDLRPFTSHLQPYIMRMSCHEALPNRNMLP